MPELFLIAAIGLGLCSAVVVVPVMQALCNPPPPMPAPAYDYGRYRMKKAPWPDFAGKDIHEGDTIEHPSGERGTVVFLELEIDPSDQWRVDYGVGVMSRLCLQIGDKGRAVVTHSPTSKVLDRHIHSD